MVRSELIRRAGACRPEPEISRYGVIRRFVWELLRGGQQAKHLNHPRVFRLNAARDGRLVYCGECQSKVGLGR